MTPLIPGTGLLPRPAACPQVALVVAQLHMCDAEKSGRHTFNDMLVGGSVACTVAARACQLCVCGGSNGGCCRCSLGCAGPWALAPHPHRLHPPYVRSCCGL